MSHIVTSDQNEHDEGPEAFDQLIHLKVPATHTQSWGKPLLPTKPAGLSCFVGDRWEIIDQVVFAMFIEPAAAALIHSRSTSS